MTTTPPIEKKWRFTSLGEDTTITLAGLAAGGLFFGLCAAVFSPVVMGAAAAYATIQLSRSYAGMFIPAVREHALRSLRRSPHYREVPATAPISQMVAEQSARLGWQQPPAIFYIGEHVLKSGMPWWARGIFNNAKIRRRILESSFSAVPGLNIIMTTGEALHNISAERLAFITAHEMSHLKKDRLSLPIHIRSIKRHFFTPLVMAAAAGLLLPLAGITLPLFIGSAITGIALLATAYIGSGWINNIGMRALERRADRNALYLQQSETSVSDTVAVFKSARIALEQIHHAPLSAARKKVIFKEIGHTHPSQFRRDLALRQAFAKVVGHIDPTADAKTLLHQIDAEQKANPVIWWRQSDASL